MQDAFAIESYQKSNAAIKNKNFDVLEYVLEKMVPAKPHFIWLLVFASGMSIAANDQRVSISYDNNNKILQEIFRNISSTAFNSPAVFSSVLGALCFFNSSIVDNIDLFDLYKQDLNGI